MDGGGHEWDYGSYSVGVSYPSSNLGIPDPLPFLQVSDTPFSFTSSSWSCRLTLTVVKSTQSLKESAALLPLECRIFEQDNDKTKRGQERHQSEEV